MFPDGKSTMIITRVTSCSRTVSSECDHAVKTKFLFLSHLSGPYLCDLLCVVDVAVMAVVVAVIVVEVVLVVELVVLSATVVLGLVDAVTL